MPKDKKTTKKSAKTPQQPPQAGNKKKEEIKKGCSSHNQGLNDQHNKHNRIVQASLSSEQVKQQYLTEEQLQKKLKKVENKIFLCKKQLELQNIKKEQEKEKEYQFLQQIPRIQKLIGLVDQQNERLKDRLAMPSSEKEEILKEILKGYDIQMDLAKRKKEKENIFLEDEKITKFFERYLPLFRSLSSSKTLKEQLLSNLSTKQKQYHIHIWIKEMIKQQERQREERIKQQERQREERIKQISAQFNEKKTQQFRLQRKLAKTTNEDQKENIEVKLFQLSLILSNLESKIKGLQSEKKDQEILQNRLPKDLKPLKSIDFKSYQNLKSPLQIQWQIECENLKKQKLQIEQRWSKTKQQAAAKKQTSIGRLEQCFNLGRNIKPSNGKYIQDTRFYPEGSYKKYKAQLSQMEHFLQSRKQLFSNIQSSQNRLRVQQENLHIIKKELEKWKEKIPKDNKSKEVQKSREKKLMIQIPQENLEGIPYQLGIKNPQLNAPRANDSAASSLHSFTSSQRRQQEQRTAKKQNK